MRPRTLKIVVKLSGMAMPVASIKIRKYADVLKADTELLCPNCGEKPKWNGGYDCPCGEHYNHWSQLARVNKATGEPIVKTKFTEAGKDVEADAYIMDLKDFMSIADATLNEYGCVVTEEASARNLRKLLIAMERLGKVCLIRYFDTYEERICVLTLSISRRIILREIIPLNLADIKETMRVDLSGVTEKDVAEAEAFVRMLPVAKESHLYVSDYRCKGIKAKPTSPKVLELESILAKAKATA